MIEQMMRSTEFVKITVVYGHIDENGPSVRNWSARKMEITDKMGKNSRLSVKIKTFLTILSVIAIFGAGHLRTEGPFSSMCP